MSFTFDSYQSLLLPVVALLAYFGFQRGGWRELGYTLGMSLVVLLTVVFPTQFIGFIERIITNVPRVFGVLFGINAPSIPAGSLFGEPGSGRFLLTQVVLFTLLTFLVYTQKYGWAYEKTDKGASLRKPKSTAAKLLGAAFGAVTGFLWFLAINNFLNTLRDLRNDPRLPLEGTTVSVPTVPDITPLLAFVPTIVVVLLVVVLVLAVIRLPNLWK